MGDSPSGRCHPLDNEWVNFLRKPEKIAFSRVLGAITHYLVGGITIITQWVMGDLGDATLSDDTFLPPLPILSIHWRSYKPLILECQKNELLIENSCFPMKIPGENCIHNDQCLSYLFEPKYYCIDSLCQQQNLHNIPLIGIPETIMNTLSISPVRLSPPRFKKELMKPYAWIPELSFKPKIYKGQFCRGAYSRPQMMHGLVVECMSKPCAPNYECEYVHGGGRYICCSRKNIVSSQMMSSLGLAALSKAPQNYGIALPSSLYSGKI
jgi:hypothetical protein